MRPERGGMETKKWEAALYLGVIAGAFHHVLKVLGH